jgi:hypothetical protein
MAFNGYEMARAYERNVIVGWHEFIEPGSVARSWELIKGSFLSFGIQGQTQATGNRKVFLHQLTWKLFPEVRNSRFAVPDYYPQEIGDCVSFGARHGTMLLSLADILLRGDREKFRPVFSPYYYGTGRIYVGHSGGYSDGSLGSWMAEAVMKYGTLFSDEAGVPKYSGQIAKSWGAYAQNGIDKFKPVASKYLVKSAAKITTWDDLVASLVNGYPVPTASNIGYSMEPSNDGFHRQTTNWNHQMCIIGVDETYNDDHYGLILNNWGDCHGHMKDFQTGEDLPIGILRVRRKDIEKHLAQQECFAYSQFDGFPEQPIERSLFKFLSD